MYSPRPHLCSAHILMVQIITPRSTVVIFFQNPPTVLSLMEGGGSGIADNTHAHLDGPSLSAQIYSLYWISEPPIHYAFNGGGGPKCVIKDAHRSVVKRQENKSMTQGVFRTPPTDLPLTEGGVQNGIFPLASPCLYVA
jgi:hypothetical protein